MRRFLLCLLPLFACTVSAPVLSAEPPPAVPAIEVYFSPKGGCTDAIVREVNAAKSTVLVQAYWFSSAPIAKALVEAPQMV